MNKYRTHNCNELRKSSVGQKVIVSGWINKKRDHGNLLFIDLRDNYGITQCIIDKENSNFSSLEKIQLETVIKIQTPWFVEVPKGYSLLLMPLPYSDDKRFTAAMGLLRGNQPLNVQVFWHCLNSEEIIPAGTPLNQMILIKDQSVGYEINYEPNSAKFITEKFDKLFISPLDFHKEK